MKTSETTRPTLSSLPVGKRAEEGTPHNLFTVIGLDDSPSPYLSPSVKALIDQGCVFSGGARHHDIVALHLHFMRDTVKYNSILKNKSFFLFRYVF